MAGGRIRLRVRPGASESRWVERLSDGRWKVAVAAPAEGGRANRELIAFVARSLGVAPSAVRLVAGASSRDKTLEVDADLSRLEGLGEAVGEDRRGMKGKKRGKRA